MINPIDHIIKKTIYPDVYQMKISDGYKKPLGGPHNYIDRFDGISIKQQPLTDIFEKQIDIFEKQIGGVR